MENGGFQHQALIYARHEALLNLAFAEDPEFTLLCPCDAATLPREVLERVAVSHRRVDGAGSGGSSAGFEPDSDSFGGELPPPAGRSQTLRFGLTGLAEVRDRVAAAGTRAKLDPRAACSSGGGTPGLSHSPRPFSSAAL
jgi:hypothetical protein